MTNEIQPSKIVCKFSVNKNIDACWFGIMNVDEKKIPERIANK